MSYNDSYWGGRGNCPECGKFYGKITGHAGYQWEGYTAGPYLAKVSGVCKEHGEVEIGSDILLRMSRVCGKSMEWLLTGEG